MKTYRIFRLEDDKILAVRNGTSIKAVLTDYYEETLKSRGYKKPSVRGSLLSVKTKHGTKMYKAIQV